MKFKPEPTYDAEQKIWTALPEQPYFSSDQSIGQIIFQNMNLHLKRIAQISVSENTVLTYHELLANSMRVASYIRRLGMGQSDIVGLMGRNTTHMFAVVFGCFFNGIAFHSLNITYDKPTIKKLFEITKPRLIFCDGDEYEKVKSATSDLNASIVTIRNHHKDSTSIEEVLSTPIEPNFKPFHLEKGNGQTLAILCSSGTTGTPKAVTITNSQKILNTSDFMTSDDVQFTYSRMDWLTGLATTVTSGVLCTTRIITDKPFNPVESLQIIEQYKVTRLDYSPSCMAMIVNCKEFDQTNLSSLRYFIYGGDRCSIKVQQRIRNRFGTDCMHLVYAFTEAGSMVSMNWNFDEKPNSVGRLANGFKLKILSEQGESLGPNEVGEVSIYSGQYWAGYYGNPEESKKMRDSDLWFHTGDLGYMDNDGFLYIVDRKKDMLKYQNIMYYPYEIEQVISKMPDVVEVCVFGIWNQFNGDEAAAAVVKKVGSQLTAQDVVDYVKDHVEAQYKQLNGGVKIVNSLIRSGNGKTNRLATKDVFLGVMDTS